MTTLRITRPSSRRVRDASLARWSRSRLDRRPRGPVASAGVVEVDDEADPTARHPDPDPYPVVQRVHQVHVVAAAVRLLALEEQVRPEDGAVGVARPAAEV